MSATNFWVFASAEQNGKNHMPKTSGKELVFRAWGTQLLPLCPYGTKGQKFPAHEFTEKTEFFSTFSMGIELLSLCP